MSLYKAGSVYWSYIMINGVRHRQSTGTRNRRRAELIDRRFRDELEAKAAGFVELQPDMTFTELASRFLSGGEIKAHHTDRLKILLPYWGQMELRSITRASAREYRAARMRGRKLTDTTVNRDLEVLRHILFWAVDEGIIQANPLARLQMPRSRKRKRPILGWDDEQKLLVHASVHLARIIVCALDTGMRRGEITRQLWEDIDFNRGVLAVTHSKTAEGEYREIPLTGRMRAMLAVGRQLSGPVFTFKDEPVARIKTAWAGAIRRAGIARLRFHDLRHTFNTRLLELGVLADVRKALMGHSSGEDVHSIYTHVELPLKRKAIELLNDWMREQMQPNQHMENRYETTSARMSNLRTERPEEGDSLGAV